MLYTCLSGAMRIVFCVFFFSVCVGGWEKVVVGGKKGGGEGGKNKREIRGGREDREGDGKKENIFLRTGRDRDTQTLKNKNKKKKKRQGEQLKERQKTISKND